MNLKKLLSWTTPRHQQHEAVAQSIPAVSEPNPTEPENKVVYLNSNPNNGGFGFGPKMDDATSVQASTIPTVLMYESELLAFFAQNYFGLGRHNGMVLKSMEALELGRAEVISKFQNSCSAILERKHSRRNKLQSEIIAIEGVSVPTSKRLELACAHLEREISLLEGQANLAAEGKGWVLEALNRYQMGFQKGVREAIEFELMAG